MGVTHGRTPEPTGDTIGLRRRPCVANRPLETTVTVAVHPTANWYYLEAYEECRGPPRRAAPTGGCLVGAALRGGPRRHASAFSITSPPLSVRRSLRPL